MTLLMQSPLLVGLFALLLLASAAAVYFQTRSQKALLGCLFALLIGGGLVALERWWQTPTEQVQSTLSQLFNAVRANDQQAVLRLLDSKAIEIRADAETLMPQFEVLGASEGGELKVELDDPAEPQHATVTLKPILKVRHKKSGTTGGYFERLTLELVLREVGGKAQWLLTAYETKRGGDFRDEARAL